MWTCFIRDLKKDMVKQATIDFKPTRFYTAIKNVMPLGDPRIQEVNGIFLT